MIIRFDYAVQAGCSACGQSHTQGVSIDFVFAGTKARGRRCVMDSCPASYGACYCNGVLRQDLLYQHLLQCREKARAATQVAQERRAWARQTVTTFLFDSGFLNGTEVAPPCNVPRIRTRRAKVSNQRAKSITHQPSKSNFQST
jgi:hypothetical protein